VEAAGVDAGAVEGLKDGGPGVGHTKESEQTKVKTRKAVKEAGDTWGCGVL
jgi:hypothetical protein